MDDKRSESEQQEFEQARSSFAEMPLNLLKARYYMYTGRLAGSDDPESLIAEIMAFYVTLPRKR